MMPQCPTCKPQRITGLHTIGRDAAPGAGKRHLGSNSLRRRLPPSVWFQLVVCCGFELFRVGWTHPPKQKRRRRKALSEVWVGKVIKAFATDSLEAPWLGHISGTRLHLSHNQDQAPRESTQQVPKSPPDSHATRAAQSHVKGRRLHA